MVNLSVWWLEVVARDCAEGRVYRPGLEARPRAAGCPGAGCRGGGRRARSPHGPGACGAGTRAAAGTARTTSSTVSGSSPTEAASVDRPTGPPPNRCTIACRIAWSSRSRPSLVDLEDLEARPRDLAGDRPVVTHLGEVAHAPQQPVRDARRAAGAPGDLGGARLVEPHLEDAGRAPDDATRGRRPGSSRAAARTRTARAAASVMRPGRVVAADQREPRQLQPDRARGRTLAEHDVEHEVLERRVQHLLDRARHAVDLVDEQHVAVVEVREDRGEVARAIERRPARGLEPGPHLVRHDLGERGLAEPGRAAEQQVVDGFAAPPRAVDQQLELFLHPFLADEVGERVVGRSATSNSRSSGSTTAASIRRSSSTAPAHLLQRLAQQVVDLASVGVDVARGLGGLLRREAERDERVAHVDDRTALARQLGLAAEPVAQVDHDPLRDLLADARHDGERVGVTGDHGSPERVGAHRRQEREPDLRADAGDAGQQVEELALVGASRSRTASSSRRARPCGCARGRSCRRRGAGSPPRWAPRRRSRRRRPRARRWSRPSRTTSPSRNEIIGRPRRAAAARSRRPMRCVRATAAASTASGLPADRGSRARARARRAPAACRRCPRPVTALFTSVGLYSSTASPASAAATMTAPVARATVSALTWFRLKATRSTATLGGVMGRDRRAHRSRQRHRGDRPRACRRRSSRCRPRAASAAGRRERPPRVRASRHAGVHPEHTGIEHLFVQSTRAPDAGQTRHRNAHRSTVVVVGASPTARIDHGIRARLQQMSIRGFPTDDRRRRTCGDAEPVRLDASSTARSPIGKAAQQPTARAESSTRCGESPVRLRVPR